MGKRSNKDVGVVPKPRTSLIAEAAASTRRVLQSHLEAHHGAIDALKDELTQLRGSYRQVTMERNSLLERVAQLSAAQDDRRCADAEWQRVKNERDRLEQTTKRLRRENEALVRRTGVLERELSDERSRRLTAEQELDYLAQQAEQLKSFTRELARGGD